MSNSKDKPVEVSFFSALKIEDAIRAGVLLCAFIVVAYCIWILDRGFEITDEAYYLLSAMHADSLKVFLSAQQWITGGIWHITDSLVMYRAAGLLLLLLSASLLSLGVFSACLRFNLIPDRAFLKAVLISGSVIGALLYASTINLSPSYNLLASAGAYAAAGLVLLATNQTRYLYKYVLYCLAGFALAVEFISKFPAGISTLALLLFWLAIFERSRIDKIFGSLVVLLGTLACVGIVLQVNTTVFEAVHGFEQGFQANSAGTPEPIGVRLVRYITGYMNYFMSTMSAYVIPVATVTAYALFRKPLFAIIALIALVAILLFGSLDGGSPTFLISNVTFDSYIFGGFGKHTMQVTATVAMLIMALAVSVPIWSKNSGTLVFFIGLIMLPYTVAIGTGNAIFTQVIDSLAPWGVLVSVLVVANYPPDRSNIPASIIGGVFMVIVTLQIVTSGLRPYHLPLTLAEHDQVVEVGALGDVRVNATTHKFIKDMKSASVECGIEPGAPYIGLYNIAGVALALQAKTILSPWVINKTQAEYLLDLASTEELESLVVAVQMTSKGELPLLPEQLEAFPSGYQYCGVGTYPYLQQKIKIWRRLA